MTLHVVSDSGDSGRIDYDEKAVLSLLDRTSSHDDAPDEEKDIMANEYLASFKVRTKKSSHLIVFRNNYCTAAAWENDLRMSKEKEQENSISYAALL